MLLHEHPHHVTFFLRRLNWSSASGVSSGAISRRSSSWTSAFQLADQRLRGPHIDQNAILPIPALHHYAAA
jgi:hypothetical protein